MYIGESFRLTEDIGKQYKRRFIEKGMGLMALTGRRPAEIFFAAKFGFPKKAGLIFEGQLKTANLPAQA
jgi:hypothetical protein